MENLIAKYSKIPAKQRYALLGFLVVGLVFGYWYLYHSELVTNLNTLESQYHALEEERAEKQAYVDNLARYEARLNELQQDLNTARSQLPDTDNVPQLLAQLGNKGRQSGLSIRSFKPKGESVKNFVAEISFAMSVTGSYHEIGTFIDAVGKLDRIINVVDISMKSPKTVNKKVILQASFTLKTYRFAAKKKPTKKKKKG